MSTVVACKRKLRASLRTKLKSLLTSDIEAQCAFVLLDSSQCVLFTYGTQAKLVAAQVRANPGFKRAQTISCYLSMPSGELDTSYLVRSILESGVSIFQITHRSYLKIRL